MIILLIYFSTLKKCLLFRLLCFIHQTLTQIMILILLYPRYQPKVAKNGKLILQLNVVIKVIRLFFRIDEANSEIVYCKICEHNLFGTRQKPYPYTRKGGNTSN